MTDIIVARRILTDGSYVHDVVFGGQLLPARSEADAFAIAERFADAINHHTDDTAKIVTDY